MPARAQVRRAEVIATAETYRTFRWTPTALNVFHGKDRDGIQVDTPDNSFSRPGIRPGWWVPQQENIGMPYMWGGFSTPQEFRRALNQGRYAGDVYTLEKRRLGDAAVSRNAVGIDCSGLISRCWKLDRAYSTRELPTLCMPLTSYDDLKAGDVLNSTENHVLLFKAWTDGGKTRMLAYEAGSPPTWKVLLNNIPVPLLTGQHYKPFRYTKIRD